ncbi:hypothetical protein H0O03_04480 [Candidatus Micrarchaeota archaeon]|nr:hypothetical protein [Candidatus Micrarchaeota archaeon]
MEKRSRAFIAAPLIGTIVFLTAIVFVVNINKADTAEVKQIVSNAYHNRIVSLLELYRADLGALFRESMGRLFQNALADPCWTLFDVPLYPGQNIGEPPEPPEPDLTKKNRLESCNRVKEVLDAVICADTGVSCNPAATDEASCGAGCTWRDSPPPDEANCIPDLTGVPRFGLQEWVLNLKTSGVFEGVLFTPAGEIAGTNYTPFDFFIQPDLYRTNPTVNPRCTASPSLPGCNYVDNCKSLIPGILFDCANFATNNAHPFSCCRKYRRGSEEITPLARDYKAELGDVCIDPIEGCENGNFFVQINVEDPQVFSNLPRLQATDGAGNEIRSGAIADANFLLPIKYPFFKYMDASFRVYDRLAYGARGTAYASDQIRWQNGGFPGDQAGIVSGFCIGSVDGCNNHAFPGLEIPAVLSFTSEDVVGTAFASSPDARLAAKESASTNYAEQFRKAIAAASVHSDSPVAVSFYELSGGAFNCTSSAGVVTACAPAEISSVLTPYLANAFTEFNCRPGEAESKCAFISRLPMYSQIIDFNPAYRVSMTKPNIYCWTAKLFLWEGRQTNPLPS